MFKIFMCIFLIAGAASAQTAPVSGLFPELGQVKSLPSVPQNTQGNASSQEEFVVEDETVTPQGMVDTQEIVAGQTETAEDVSKKEEEAAMKKAKGKLVLMPDEMQVVLPPARNFSFCSGKLILENQTGFDLKGLSMSLTFGPLKVPVSFGGVADKGTANQDFGAVGKACESFLGAPMIDVQACSLGDFTLQQCRALIQYKAVQ